MRSRQLMAACVLWALTLEVRAFAPPNEGLDQILADYRLFELPMPPPNAGLAIVGELSNVTVNGIRDRYYYLTFVESDVMGKPSICWNGESRFPIRSDEVRFVDPNPSEFEKTSRMPTWQAVHQSFPSDPDLALAAQCHARGWTSLAETIVARSRKGDRGSFRQPPRPRGDRAALAQMAWNHYCNCFASATDKRQAIVDQLGRILDSSAALATEARRNILADMRRTIDPRKPPAKQLELLIDDLLQRDIPGAQVECASRYHDPRDFRRSVSYRALLDARLQSVPVLMGHLDDYRITRSIASTNVGDYTWHVRIADVVAQLLNELAGEEFSHNFLENEGRGVRVDRAHVTHWYNLAAARENRDRPPGPPSRSEDAGHGERGK